MVIWGGHAVEDAVDRLRQTVDSANAASAVLTNRVWWLNVVIAVLTAVQVLITLAVDRRIDKRSQRDLKRKRTPMARRGDGIYLRGKTWWLDFTHDGKRHVARLGKGINRTAAGELAQVQRAAILKGEAGIGGAKRKDPHLRDAGRGVP